MFRYILLSHCQKWNYLKPARLTFKRLYFTTHHSGRTTSLRTSQSRQGTSLAPRASSRTTSRSGSRSGSQTGNQATSVSRAGTHLGAHQGVPKRGHRLSMIPIAASEYPETQVLVEDPDKGGPSDPIVDCSAPSPYLTSFS
jgi:hypothetical protein